MSKAVLVTGSSGFVGRELCVELVRHQFSVTAAMRGEAPELAAQYTLARIADIGPDTDWTAALQGVEVVIHLAARVHVMRDHALDPLSEFRRTNAAGTEHLARCAAAAGVKRLVYVSSIKVNGEETVNGHRYSEQDIPAPQDPYGISKSEAELAVQRVAQETGLEVVIVRPPLIYGAEVKGNFIQMMKVVARGIPLPLGALHNRRDLLYVGNLADALIACATHPAAAGQTYVLCDGEPVSTSELLQRLAQALGVSPRLFPFPTSLLELAGKLGGKSDQINRLLGSLQIDSAKIRRELNWTPPFTMQQGLQATAEWYLNSRK
ncbi:MAG: SDR family oxidoreductase [Sideroxydans sp.]|nr:SDR family oxidoreductase [Sideroxydans sp.]